jgi:tyrosinase
MGPFPPTLLANRPAVPLPFRIRRNILSLPADDPIIDFYRQAIGAMKAKPIADPLSWRFQAAIHDYRASEDPFADPSDVLPSAAEQGRFWNQCQHSSWFFLPWHRMYLHFFEKIVMAEVARLGGPSDWALPYWNYSASPAAARLPAPFRARRLRDGSPNHLFVAERHRDANRGRNFVGAGDTDLTACLREASFESGGGSAGFGGPKTVFSHAAGITLGALEGTPHATMHVAVSGPAAGGFMGSFTRAPLDPIFWLHHCNLDRLWEVWLRRVNTHANPTTNEWLLDVPFSFHDATGAIVNMTPAEVVVTFPTPLAYVYDDTSDPLGGPP